MRSTRQVAERFVQALQGDSDVRLDCCLALDAEVFLQGAPIPMSAARLQDYVDVLRRGRQEFQPASRIFVTTTGAGWLLSIGPTPDQTSFNPPAPAIPPQLWMEAAIRDAQVRRVWIHFTVEAMPRINVQPETYRAAAAARGIPVPDGWSDGTPALLAAAERVDPVAFGGWTDPNRQPLILALGGLVAVGGFFVARLRGRRRQHIVRETPGALLKGLRKAHSAADGGS